MAKNSRFDRFSKRLDEVIGMLAPQISLRREKSRALAQHYKTLFRKYESATSGKRTRNWYTSPSGSNTEIGGSISKIRDRARALVRDNPYAAGILQTLVSNTIGTGILAEPQHSNLAVLARSKELWNQWADSTECDADGVLNYYGLQSLGFRSMVESGEVLVRRRRRRSMDGLTVPLQIQLLEPDFLDHSKTQSLQDSGNQIIQGVEFDKVGKRVAYWMYDTHPGENLGTVKSSYESKRIKASEIIHVYDPTRCGQVRAVSFFAPVILTLRDMDELNYAQLTKQKIAACFTAFIRDIADLGSEQLEDEQEEIENLEPGAVFNLSSGKTIEFANPPSATGADEFNKTLLRSVAKGMGTTYEAATGDLSGVNYSSGRMGRLEFNRNIEHWRWNVYIPNFCQKTWGWWMDAASFVPGFNPEGLGVTWTPPRKELIDPTREIPATIKAIRGGLMSLSEAIRESGHDPKQLLEEMKKDSAMLDSLGLVLDSDPRKTMSSGSIQTSSAPSAAPTSDDDDEPVEPEVVEDDVSEDESGGADDQEN